MIESHSRNQEGGGNKPLGLLLLGMSLIPLAAILCRRPILFFSNYSMYAQSNTLNSRDGKGFYRYYLEWEAGAGAGTRREPFPVIDCLPPNGPTAFNRYVLYSLNCAHSNTPCLGEFLERVGHSISDSRLCRRAPPWKLVISKYEWIRPPYPEISGGPPQITLLGEIPI